MELPGIERILIVTITGLLLAASATELASGAVRRTDRMTQLYDRIVFSTSSLINPNIKPEKAIDGDHTTFWSEELPGGKKPGPSHLEPKAVGSDDTLYLQFEIGLSHFPGNPPIPNPLHSLRIVPLQGHAFARPRKVRLLFFRQKVVDVDRDFEFAGSPELLAEKRIEMKDSIPMDVSLSFLPRPAFSPHFPRGLVFYWMRLEFESLYQGEKFPLRLAVSEVEINDQFHTFPEYHGYENFPSPP